MAVLDPFGSATFGRYVMTPVVLLCLLLDLVRAIAEWAGGVLNARLPPTVETLCRSQHVLRLRLQLTSLVAQRLRDLTQEREHAPPGPQLHLLLRAHFGLLT